MADCRSADADYRRRSKECSLLCLIGGESPSVFGRAQGWTGRFLLNRLCSGPVSGGEESGWEAEKKTKRQNRQGGGSRLCSGHRKRMGASSADGDLQSVDCGSTVCKVS